MILITDKTGTVVQTIEGGDATDFTGAEGVRVHLTRSRRAGLGWVLRNGRFVPPPVTPEKAAAAMEKRIAAMLPPSHQARALAAGRGADLTAWLDAMAAAAGALAGKNTEPLEPTHWPAPETFNL